MARELAIVVTAETQQAEQNLQRVEARLQGVEKAAEQTGDAVGDVEAAAKKTSGALGPLNTALGQAAQQFAKLGPGGMVGAVAAPLLAAAKAAVDFTGGIDKAAKRAQVSVDTFQSLDFVARKNETTFDRLAHAMTDLDVRLAKGSKTTVAAVGAIGMEIDDLLSLSRDDRFSQIAKAIGDIEDPAEQARLAVELFGEAGKDLLPVFRDLAAGAEEHAPRMSGAFIEAGAQVKRAMDDLVSFSITKGQQLLSYLMLWPAALANWSTSVSEALWGVAGQLPTVPGAPTMPWQPPSGFQFDPLNGQSMGFVERQLTQGAQGRPGVSRRPGAPNVLDVAPYVFSGGTPIPMRGSLGFPGWATPPLAGTPNTNWAGFAPTVAMNAPGVGGGSWLGNFLRGSGGRIAGAIGGNLLGLLPGMSGIGSSIGSGIGSAIGSVGSLAGSTIGSFLGPLGGIAGGLLGKLFGPSEGVKTNRTRDSFIDENFGSVDALRAAADKAGFSVDRLLSVRKVKDFEAEVRRLNQALMASEQDAVRTEEAMARWGLTIEDMGPKFQQTKINDAFKEAMEDLRVLTAAGADFTTVAEKMGPTLGGFIQEAIEMGGTVPRELEPILKKMIEMGVLTDKNGDKFTELSQIPFAQDLNKDFQTLISKMDALIDRISELPGLFDDAANAAGRFAGSVPGGGGAGGSAPTMPTPGGGGGGEATVSVAIDTVTVGVGASRAQTAEMVGSAAVAYMERRGVRFGARVA